MKPYLYLTLLLGCTGIACQSGRYIRIDNNSGTDAEVIWKIKEDSIHQSPMYISNSVHSAFVISGNRPFNKLNMSVGVGNWTPTTLKDFVDDFENVEIKWGSKKIILDSTNLFQYLIPRRRGFDKGGIYIVLK